MILFPVNAQYTDIIGSKLVEKNKRKLEETLIKLGNFNPEEPIKIFNHHLGSTQSIITYEVKDLDDTTFTFNNYVIDTLGYTEILTMKRKNSRFTYKYSFGECMGIDYQENKSPKEYTETLKVIEISCLLRENTQIKINFEDHLEMKIIIEVGTKQYVLETSRYSYEKLLSELENMVEKLTKIDTLNLESILSSISNKDLINRASIINNNKIIAQLNFICGKLCRYEYEQHLLKVSTIISSQIYRSTEMVKGNEIETNTEIIEDNSENRHIQADYKKLFKKL